MPLAKPIIPHYTKIMPTAETSTSAPEIMKTKGTRPGVRGRPEWLPARQMFRSNGVTGLETQDQAWERAKNWVRHCISIGTPQAVVCTIMSPPCDMKTLRKYFLHELENGKAHQTALIAGRLVQQALAGDGAQQRFWLATQAGWRQGIDATVSGVIQVRNIEGDDAE